MGWNPFLAGFLHGFTHLDLPAHLEPFRGERQRAARRRPGARRESAHRVHVGDEEVLAVVAAMAISDITLFEISMLVQRGVVELKPDATTGLQKFADSLVVLPIDRVVVARALAHNLTLVTKDRQITDAAVVKTLW